MVWNEAHYEEPQEAGCSCCGEEDPICNKCGAELWKEEIDFSCNGEEHQHIKCPKE